MQAAIRLDRPVIIVVSLATCSILSTEGQACYTCVSIQMQGGVQAPGLAASREGPLEGMLDRSCGCCLKAVGCCLGASCRCLLAPGSTTWAEDAMPQQLLEA